MKILDKAAPPDFEVTWHNGSVGYKEDIYCEPPCATNSSRIQSRLRRAVATLQTDTTHVEVSEVSFASPVSLIFTPHRPGFSLLSSASVVASMDYGYEKENLQSARLENVLFMLPGREIKGSCSAGVFRTVTCSYELRYAEQTLGSFDEISPSQLVRALDMKSSLTISILMRLMNEAIFPGPISKTVVESLGNALLVECKHWMLSGVAQQEGNSRLTAKHIEIIESYLSSLTAKAPSVTELAAVCGFSDRYFARLFREQFGCSISQYLKSAQIAKAKTYLLETDLPLKEIAHRLGFGSLPNFSFAFRSFTGITPGRFRKPE